jgi:hypothetical protein
VIEGEEFPRIAGNRAVPQLPSRALGAGGGGLPGIGCQRRVDGVADPAFERPQRVLVGLALGAVEARMDVLRTQLRYAPGI